jgi:hypothetical protein
MKRNRPQLHCTVQTQQQPKLAWGGRSSRQTTVGDHPHFSANLFFGADAAGGVAPKCYRLCFVLATEQYGTVAHVCGTLRWQRDDR